jgi:hypothetical protein
MNERIKQLEKQCWQSSQTRPYALFDVKKFSQLIVRECISIVDEQKECLHEEQQYWHDRDYGYALAVDDASKGIKQFFGVEE